MKRGIPTITTRARVINAYGNEETQIFKSKGHQKATALAERLQASGKLVRIVSVK